jgi:putative endopeptidase
MRLPERPFRLLALAGSILALVHCEPAGSPGPKPGAPPVGPGAAPAGGGAPQIPAAFDRDAIDRGVNPCVDFYQYACGAWIKNNPIPADRGAYGRTSQLDESNLAILHDILEKAAGPDSSPDPGMRKIGDFYSSCMDEKGAESKGAAPLKPDLDAIAALASKAALAPLVGRLQAGGMNVVPGDTGVPSLLFTFESEQDFKDASTQIAALDQGGIGLPDRDYYLKQDAKSVEIRGQYVDHVARVLQLLGASPEAAAAAARKVMAVETGLAKASLEKVARREPANIYHKMTQARLAALAPSFDWRAYLSAVGAPSLESLNVRAPEFFRGLERLLRTTPLDVWKDYLRWHLARAWSGALSSGFVNAHFDFYSRILAGQKELRPRWKRCVTDTDGILGEALGRPYVSATLGVEGKERTIRMVRAIEKSLDDDIASIPWMTPTTRARALEKLHAITNKIGYPDHWRDYGSLAISSGDFLGNVQRGRAFEFRRWLDKIGKPIDPSEWHMTPPTINAYYDPQMNNINFPAGILRPPFYDNAADDPVNFGGIGMVVGHELTHGFDDTGRQFDASGNLRDWWTPEDASEFRKRAACFVDEYSAFTAVGDVKLNGKLTLGENVADNGGLRLAYMGLRAARAGGGAVSPPGGAQAAAGASEDGGGTIDGFTPEQRFFIANAQIWCVNMSDELSRLIAQTNTHALPRFRVNGVMSNMSEFQQAFSCPAGSPMVRANPCRIW